LSSLATAASALALAVGAHAALGVRSPIRPSSAHRAARTCPAFLQLDSRGSGETPGRTSPPGAAFAAEFERRHRTVRFAVVDNPYAAVGLWGNLADLVNLVGFATGSATLDAYRVSVAAGERWLSREVASESSSCPATRLVLTGYSQGAEVTGDVYQRDLSGAQRSHVLAVILFGDPYFNPVDARADRGSYLESRGGILGRRPRFGGDPRVVSYCHLHDPICQLPTLAELLLYRLTQHDNYPPDASAAAGRL
jgi:hypothetical protein